MIFGMSISTFTQVHVVLSLIGIAAGLVVVTGMFGSKVSEGWTALFLSSTILTSATGFLFPTKQVLPSHVVGGLSLVVLAVAVLAYYRFQLAGAWRSIYVIAAVVALWFNVFVAVVQAFLKVQFLHALAPGQGDPPFLVAEGVVLVAFFAITVVALRTFHPVMPVRQF